MMTEEERTEFQKLLAEQRAEYQETLRGSTESAKGMELDQQRVGRLSRMDALQDQSISQAANRRIAKELQQIEAALERIQDGTYGTCQSCGQPISLLRLQAIPAAPNCITCAS